uniref:Mitochondrial ribosomal protein L41 n=2 Tax=Esox lucius TaxID=8010 RepID=A0AAY5KQI9_ESOLU
MTSHHSVEKCFDHFLIGHSVTGNLTYNLDRFTFQYSAAMGVLNALRRGLLRGADRMAEFTSKRGGRSNYKGRGAQPTGILTSSRKFIPVQAMIPQFVVPNLEGFKLKPYVSYRSPVGTEPPVTPEGLFSEAVAPQIQKDLEEGSFDMEQLEKYGFEPTQEGKLFKLYPKNFVK